jgi:FkbM family methyltransferase
MNRPVLLRLAPPRVRISLYFKIYRSRRQRWRELYDKADLHFAHGVRMNLWPTDEGHSSIAFTGIYELDLSQRLRAHAHSGGLLLDVGANYGYFSLLWAAASPRNRVISFEASPRNHAALRKNIISNGFESRIELREVAVGQRPGKQPFSVGCEEQTGWGGFCDTKDEATVQVPVVTLDSSISDREVVEVLKIDVEGADTWVLYGAQKLLQSKRIKNIYFEQNKGRLRKLGIGDNDAANFLHASGYEVTPLNDPALSSVEYHATPRA